MSEYDYSPENVARYISTQIRVSNWVAHAEKHRPQFENALTVPPNMASSHKTKATADPVIPHIRKKSRPAPRTPSPCSSASASPQVKEYGALQGPSNVSGLSDQVPPHDHYTRSRSPLRSNPRHKYSSHSHDKKSGKKSRTYIVAVPPTAVPTYSNGVSGWVPSPGLVIVSSKKQKISAVVRFFHC
jgi:hypothetical protein